MTKTRKIILGILSMVIVFCLGMVFVPNVWNVDAAEAANPDFYINFSDVEGITNITEDIELGDGKFNLVASTSRPLAIDGNSKKSPDNKFFFSKRLKLENKPTGNLERSVGFFLEKKAEITVYGFSGKGGTSRTLSLFKQGKAEAVAVSPVLAESGDYVDAFTWNTEEAGSYYIGATEESVNIYYIGIRYTGDAAPVAGRKNWAEVAAPTINKVDATTAQGSLISVDYTGVVGTDGADYALVHMYLDGEEQPVETRRVLLFGTGKTGVKFQPTKTGKYSFATELVRVGETSKVSAKSENVDFTYKLYQPEVDIKTVKDANDKLTLGVTVTQVAEADFYTVSWKLKGTTDVLGTQDLQAVADAKEVEYVIPDLAVGSTYEISVTATRNTSLAMPNEPETTEPVTVEHVVRNDVERDWQFTYFGTSTKEELNYMASVGSTNNDNGGNLYDGFRLNSCTFDETTGKIVGKGGKFTDGFSDGISYYYTQIKANEEDFRLRARITIDYRNPTVDGQEGFALLVRDSIGEHGSTAPFYTNSAAAIGSKIKQGTLKENRAGIGARLVTGVKLSERKNDDGTVVVDNDGNPVLYEDTKLALTKKYFFDRTVQYNNGLEYIFEVEKKNNVYYMRYINYTTKEVESEIPLFHTEEENDNDPTNDINYDPLCQIDKENVYVGFAVARGCNATFEDIEFETTPKCTDYIPIEPVPIYASSGIASPTTTSIPQYNFKFNANSNGTVNVYLNDDGTRNEANLVIKDQKIEANVYFEQIITLTEAENKFDAYFIPEPGWKTEYHEALNYYGEQPSEKLVSFKSYGQELQGLVVAPTEYENSPTGVIGSPAGTGALNDPLDLQTAINFLLPGQTIYMLDGTYVKTDANYTVEKGNDGTPEKVKTIRPHPSSKARPVLDFNKRGGGFTLWGSYWHIKGFDITKTPDGKKGLQVGGHYCIVEDICAYENGDSGIQVSGKSTDLPQFWPTNNLILNCTSYSNADSGREDADGFGAKLYCGKGNVFKGCLAYCNADDGWDLFSKTETGSIGQVIIENCITFGNGFTVDGQTPENGNGNGFKLGGESLTGKHIIRNSLSFANRKKGIDSNSCPDIQVFNCTSIYNGTSNYSFYTKKDDIKTEFKAQNNISLLGFANDEISKMQADGDEFKLVNETNYFFYRDNTFKLSDNSTLPKGSYNVSGTKLDYTKLNGWETVDKDLTDEFDDDAFKYFGLEITSSKVTRGNFSKILEKIYRKEDGSLAIKDGYLSLEEGAATTDVGATLQATPGTHTAPVTVTYKDKEGKDFTVTFGENYNKEPAYIANTEGKDLPNFDYEITPPDDGDDDGNSSGGNSQNSSTTPSSSSSAPKDNEGSTNMAWLWILLGVVAVVGIGAAVYFLVIKKKNN